MLSKNPFISLHFFPSPAPFMMAFHYWIPIESHPKLCRTDQPDDSRSATSTQLVFESNASMNDTIFRGCFSLFGARLWIKGSSKTSLNYSDARRERGAGSKGEPTRCGAAWRGEAVVRPPSAEHQRGIENAVQSIPKKLAEVSGLQALSKQNEANLRAEVSSGWEVAQSPTVTPTQRK